MLFFLNNPKLIIFTFPTPINIFLFSHPITLPKPRPYNPNMCLLQTDLHRLLPKFTRIMTSKLPIFVLANPEQNTIYCCYKGMIPSTAYQFYLLFVR